MPEFATHATSWQRQVCIYVYSVDVVSCLTMPWLLLFIKLGIQDQPQPSKIAFGTISPVLPENSLGNIVMLTELING